MSTHQLTYSTKPVVVLLVGGVDPGTGAGVFRDLLTAAALGAHARVVATAWTEQGPDFELQPREAGQVQAGLTRAFTQTAETATAVKIGMVATAAIARAIAAGIAPFHGSVVYDPVLRASSGGLLYEGDRQDVLALARQACLLTPNLAEAAWLLDRPVRTRAEARDAARALRDLGIPAVLVKGGHLEGEATDVLASPAGETLFEAPRIAGPSPRGTGCALATAVAVGLATGAPLEVAIASAKTWLARRIAGASAVGSELHL